MARTADRRVEKTMGLLHGALASLIHEKSFDGIGVKEILARANVGRSTFYTHFRDKDELLERSIRDVITKCAMRGQSSVVGHVDHVLRFSLPLLEHISSYRALNRATGDGRQHASIHERLRDALVEQVVHDLQQIPHRRLAPEQMTIELLADFVASTFVLVLSRCLEGETQLSARLANAQFLGLTRPVLGKVLASST